MTTDDVRAHIRAALAAIIGPEETKLKKMFGAQDDLLRQQVEMMQPVLSLLRALAAELGPTPSVTIDIPAIEHMASVKAGSTTITISRTSLNALYQVDTRDQGPITPDGYFPTETSASYGTAEEVMGVVLPIVGKEVALQQVIAARQKRGAV